MRQKDQLLSENKISLLEMIHPFDDIFEYAVLQHRWLFYCHQKFLDFPLNAIIEVQSL